MYTCGAGMETTFYYLDMWNSLIAYINYVSYFRTLQKISY